MDDKFPILRLDSPVEHVVGVSEGVTDGNRIHFGTVEGGRGDHLPNLFTSVITSQLACYKTEEREGAQSRECMFYDSLCSSVPCLLH